MRIAYIDTLEFGYSKEIHLEFYDFSIMAMFLGCKYFGGTFGMHNSHVTEVFTRQSRGNL